MISFRRSIASFTFGLIVVCGWATGNQVLRAQEKQWVKAPALKRGDTIALVAPAGPVEIKTVKEFAEQLEMAGYKVIIPKGIERKSGYLAGADDERASELNAAIRDPKVRAIFPCRGGYGVIRILDRIDYPALRRDPKIIVGFSDITALHLAIARESHLITFHAPMSLRGIAVPDKEASFAVASFKRAIFADQSKDRVGGYTIDAPTDRPKPVKLVSGKAQGRLMGGNLTMICSTLGTPYAIQPKGAILFIEDLNEAPYRVDRYLSQLRLAGALDAISGVVIGNFSSKEVTDAKEFERVFQDYFATRKIPVLMNFPVGHVSHNATLPHGAMAEVDADASTLRLVENPVKDE